MENLNNKPTTVGAQDGPLVSMAGGNYRVIIGGEQTGGAYAVIEMLVPPGGGPGPHAHAEIQESFYVVDGEVEVKSEAGTYMATKGAFVNIPLGGVVHRFKNKSQEMARLICTVMPAGMEKMFLEMGKPTTADTFLPAPAITPELLEQMRKVSKKYGQKLFPPDYLDK